MQQHVFKLLVFMFLAPLSLVAKLVDTCFIPYQQVISIFQAFSPLFMEHQKVLLQNPTLENLNEIAQNAFLRHTFVNYVSAETVELFKAIGYLLINGSTTSNMKHRIKSLVRLLQEEKLSLDITEIVF